MAYDRESGDRDDDSPYEDSIYDEFPSGNDDENGVNEGFNTWIQINDASLFREEVLENNPALQQFVNAPFAVTFAQFKSSHRESEYWLHKPSRAMTGNVSGIFGVVPGVGGEDDERTRISTLVLNHEQSLAYHITRSVVISDQTQAGQIIHKEPGRP